MLTSKTLLPDDSGMEKRDSLDQFNDQPVLGINILGRTVPIEATITLAPGVHKSGILFAGIQPDPCYFREQCYREETTTSVVIGALDEFKVNTCMNVDEYGRATTPTWSTRIKKCGDVADGAGTPLAITNTHGWWVGKTYYQPKKKINPDQLSYGYGDTKPHNVCREDDCQWKTI